MDSPKFQMKWEWETDSPLENFRPSHLYYCSQVWSPPNIKLTAAFEAIHRIYTEKIVSIQHISYWERLKSFWSFSIWSAGKIYNDYIWKILEGHCVVPTISTSSSKYKTRYWKSFGFRDPQLFIILPKCLRNTEFVLWTWKLVFHVNVRYRNSFMPVLPENLYFSIDF